MSPLHRAVAALQQRFGAPPATAIVLGSGLGGIVAGAEDPQRAPYGELGLPPTSVPGHAGELVLGRIGEARVAFLSGRIHFYEGRPASETVMAVRALALWGAKRVVLTSAVGGVDPRLEPGEVMLFEDHLNFMGRNPLLGENDATLGPRFPDMSTVYDRKLRQDAVEAARQLGMRLHSGVYAAMLGPSYETPAEIRMLRTLGASAVGMSTVPEAIALAHMGVPTIAFGLIANPAAGLTDEPLDHAEVTRAAGAAGQRLGGLLIELVKLWA